MKKVTLIGGGGVRTPLLIQGLVRARTALGIRELALYDVDRERVGLMAALGREVVREYGGEITISTPAILEEAVEGAEFVLSSIRAGGIDARARHERMATTMVLRARRPRVFAAWPWRCGRFPSRWNTRG